MAASGNPATPSPRWFAPAFAALCLLSFAVLIVSGLDADSRWSFAARCDGRDAMTYYYAAWGLVEGLNPYDRAEILRHLNETPHFVYPIFAIPFFVPLIVVSPPAALIAFGVVHLVGFVGLVLVWRGLLPIDWRWLALLLPVGFGATAVHDLCSSNVTTFESLALWLGVAALWRARPGGFIAWTALAAVPKLLWLLLLPLALLRSSRAWRGLAIVALVVVGLFGVWLILWPQTIEQWLGNVRVTTQLRYNVFTTLRLIDVMAGGEVGGPLLSRWETWAYGLWCALVAIVVFMAWKRKTGIRSLSLLTVLSLLVVWPGNLSYSWVVLLPIAAAVIFFLAERRHPGAALVLTLVCVLPQPLFDWAGLGGSFGHGTFVTVLIFWVVLAVLVFRRRDRLEAWLGGPAH